MHMAIHMWLCHSMVVYSSVGIGDGTIAITFIIIVRIIVVAIVTIIISRYA